MAKLYNKQQGNKAQEIDNGLLDKKEIRKIVVEDSISNLSEVENNFNEKEERIRAGQIFDDDDESKQ